MKTKIVLSIIVVMLIIAAFSPGAKPLDKDKLSGYTIVSRIYYRGGPAYCAVNGNDTIVFTIKGKDPYYIGYKF